jgi:hypothetical protein
MRDPEFHLRALAASLENLQAYLLSKEVFWPMGSLPSLSLGRIFWDRTVLKARHELLAGPAAGELEQLERELEDTQRRWRVAWEQKCTAELRTRINLWLAYLAELAESPEESQSYPIEVRNRTLASYLRDAAGNQAEARALGEALESLDARLRPTFRPGKFVWESELASAFPADRYWYLYGMPASD